MSTRFDLRHLRYFVAVAEELNFRRAAERLFITQPPLSRQIRELETALGTRLFERDTTMVKLTVAGEAALRRARSLLAEADAFADDMSRLAARGADSVGIGVTIAIPVSEHRRLEAAWQLALGSSALLRMEIGETQALLQRLRRREFEFALLGATVDLDQFEHEIVHTVPLIAAIAASHPAARKRTVALRDLAGTPFFWFPRTYNPGYHDLCAQVFASAGFKPRFILVRPGQQLTLERIAHGEGCTLLSGSQAGVRIKGLVQRPLREGKALGIPIAAAWRRQGKDGAPDPRGKAFAAVARRVLDERTRRAAARTKADKR